MQTWEDFVKEMIDTGTTLMLSGKSFSESFDSDAFQSEIETAIEHLKMLLRAVRIKATWEKYQKLK